MMNLSAPLPPPPTRAASPVFWDTNVIILDTDSIICGYKWHHFWVKMSSFLEENFIILNTHFIMFSAKPSENDGFHVKNTPPRSLVLAVPPAKFITFNTKFFVFNAKLINPFFLLLTNDAVNVVLKMMEFVLKTISPMQRLT